MNIEFLHLLNLNEKNVIREIAFIIGATTLCIENYVVLHNPWSAVLMAILFMKFISYYAPLISMFLPITAYINYAIMNTNLDIEHKMYLKFCWYSLGFLIGFYHCDEKNRFNKKIHRILNR